MASTLYPHLTMITGKKGSGKTLFTVSLIEQLIKDNDALVKSGKEPRQIYSDIDGLNFDSIHPAPDDWRETPNNSIIIYDEVQKREEWQRTGKRINKNEMIVDLTTMRKTNHIVYIITQHPQMIDNTVCQLIDHHLHVVRGFGLPASNIYHWEGYCSNPDNDINKSKAISEIKFNHPKRLYDKYLSGIEKDSIKTNVPNKVKFMIIFILMMIFGSVYLFFSSDFVDIAKGEHVDQIMEGEVVKGKESSPAPAQDVQRELDEAKLEIERLKKQMLGRRALYITDDDIRPSMIVSTSSGCRAYNMRGDLLILSSSECLAMSEDFALIPASPRAIASKNDSEVSSRRASDAPPL